MSGAAPSPFPLNKIAVIGPGLIGGAILWACLLKKLAKEISVCEINKNIWPDIQRSLPSGPEISFHFQTYPHEAAKDANLVFLCLPIERMLDVAKEISGIPGLTPSNTLAENAVITDVGSVKRSIVADLTAIFGGRFVGGHPMAGKEKGGFDPESAPLLFEGKTILLTPTPKTDPDAIATVKAFWKAVGAKVDDSLTPEEHDRRTAQISHLPHLVAAALAAIVDDASLHASGPGFRDTTRVAAGPAAMWRDILLANREEVGGILEVFLRELEKARRALAENRGEELQALLEKANDTRRKLEEISPSPHKTP